MPALINDRQLEQRLRAERAASGADRFDEVWDGVYCLAPMPNHLHQLLVGRWTRALDEIVKDAQLGVVLPGDGRSIQSGVLGFAASLLLDQPRPRLRVEHPASGGSWLI